MKTVSKEVVTRGRCGVLLLFNKWWGIELEEGYRKRNCLVGFFCFLFFLVYGRNVEAEYIWGVRSEE